MVANILAEEHSEAFAELFASARSAAEIPPGKALHETLPLTEKDGLIAHRGPHITQTEKIAGSD